MTRFIFGLMLVLVVCCSACPSTTPTPVEPISPPTQDLADASTPTKSLCTAAQAKLLELQCKDGHDRLIGGPNKHGKPFADLCYELWADHQVNLNPACLATIVSCDQIDALCGGVQK